MASAARKRKMIRRAILSEALGSLLLVATVIGSGIMADRLAGGNVAIALLGNTLATGAMLFVLVTMLGPVSGAHLNPVVTLIMHLRGQIGTAVAIAYVVAQLIGGILGVWLAHVMFDVPVLQLAHKIRTRPGQWTGEAVATFGLILTILGTARLRPAHIPASVALYITAAYWFTSSTSFANPAITIARSLSDSFAGIAPACVPAFVVAQIAGALAAHAIAGMLFPQQREKAA
jgi:glycerol uptake facilitator-like aquaporin